MNLRKKSGIVMPLVIFAIIAVAGFVLTLSTMSEGIRKQVTHTNNNQLSFLIAYSALANVCARIHSSSWAERPFASKPLIENKIALFDGHYDLMVENTLNQEFRADVYVRTHLGDFSRLFVWRIKYNDDILDIANRIEIEAFLQGDDEDFPTPGAANPISEKINKDLELREKNQKQSDELAGDVAEIAELDHILDILQARPRKKFSPDYPPGQSDLELAKRPAISNPVVAPQNLNEKPSGLDKPGIAEDPADTRDFIELYQALMMNMKTMIEYAQTTLEKCEERWDLVYGSMSANDEEVNQVEEEGRAARKATRDLMEKIIADAKALIRQAANNDRVANGIASMVYTCIVAADKKLVDRHVVRLERFSNGWAQDNLDRKETSDEVMKLLAEGWYPERKHVAEDEIDRMKQNYDAMKSFTRREQSEELASSNIRRTKDLVPPIDKMIKKAEDKYKELVKQGL